jgi:GT2 family glycosyltransferase
MLALSQEVPVPASGLEATVVIPVRNAERTLRQCLEAVFSSRDIGKFEVIVVDDGSSDSSVTIATRFPCKVIHGEQSRGPAAARNTGAGSAHAPRLLFVDADVFVRPDTFQRLLNALDSSPAAFATYDPEPVNRNFATLLYHALSCLSLQDTSEKTPVFYSYCAAIGKEPFLKLGGFDTNFTSATFEDMELGWRLAGEGLLSHHLKSARVDHAVHYTLSRLGRAYFRKSQDLALLLLSRRKVTFDDQGWTRRRHWVTLVCAWATLGLAPLAIWVHPLWALPWLLAVGGIVVASARLYRVMARRRWIYGPLSILAYVGILVIVTVAMLSAGLRFLRSLCHWRPSSWRQIRRRDEEWAGSSQGGRSL